jgi:hypothetical protein
MRHTRKPVTRRDFVGAQHAAPVDEPSGSLSREAAHTPEFCLFLGGCFSLGGRSFSSDINTALSSGVLTPEARFSTLPLQVSNA